MYRRSSTKAVKTTYSLTRAAFCPPSTECLGIGAVPIVDAEGRVVGIYSRSDITFLATAADPEAVLQVQTAHTPASFSFFLFLL